MNKKICTLIPVVIGILVIFAGCSPHQLNASKAIASTYGIAHCDAKELLNPERDYLVVVNRDHQYDFNGDYNRLLQPDLVYFPNVVDGDIMAAEKAAYLAFTSLQYSLRNDYGIEIGLYDGYRTASDQEFINELYSNGAPTITAQNEIGFSEHHTGLLLDFVMWYSEDGENYDWYSATPERLESIPEFKTVLEKMVDYGFIVRYPPNKTDITGIECREYEMRFVGSAATAHAITDNGLCLEEYLAKN